MRIYAAIICISLFGCNSSENNQNENNPESNDNASPFFIDVMDLYIVQFRPSSGDDPYGIGIAYFIPSIEKQIFFIYSANYVFAGDVLNYNSFSINQYEYPRPSDPRLPDAISGIYKDTISISLNTFLMGNDNMIVGQYSGANSAGDIELSAYIPSNLLDVSDLIGTWNPVNNPTSTFIIENNGQGPSSNLTGLDRDDCNYSGFIWPEPINNIFNVSISVECSFETRAGDYDGVAFDSSYVDSTGNIIPVIDLFLVNNEEAIRFYLFKD